MTTPITYPPLRSNQKPPDDPSTSVYWRFFTPQERQMLIDTPIEDATQEIALLRMSIYEVLAAQQIEPATSPKESLNTLYSISIASRVIGELIKYQRGYNKTHNKWAALYQEAMHIARIRTGMYRQMAAIGYTVPDGVLEIEPDLMPICPPIAGWTKEQSPQVPASFSGSATIANPGTCTASSYVRAPGQADLHSVETNPGTDPHI